jgi:hypothetical protein
MPRKALIGAPGAMKFNIVLNSRTLVGRSFFQVDMTLMPNQIGLKSNMIDGIKEASDMCALSNCKPSSLMMDPIVKRLPLDVLIKPHYIEAELLVVGNLYAIGANREADQLRPIPA